MMKLNNKGLSLVELVIAIAMSTIVVGAAVMFLYNAERSYRTAEYSVDVQMEAQILMEQMSNWVMNSNWIIAQDQSTDASILVLYQIPRKLRKFDLSEDEKLAKRIIVFMNEGKLYMKEQTETVAGDYLNEIKGAGFNRENIGTTTEMDCIGEYVNKFTIDLPFGVDPTKINSISVKLGMYEGVKGQAYSYSVKNQFSIRNGLCLFGEDEEDLE